MGADMIGLMPIGPRKLDDSPENIQAAVNQVVGLIRFGAVLRQLRDWEVDSPAFRQWSSAIMLLDCLPDKHEKAKLLMIEMNHEVCRAGMITTKEDEALLQDTLRAFWTSVIQNKFSLALADELDDNTGSDDWWDVGDPEEYAKKLVTEFVEFWNLTAECCHPRDTVYRDHKCECGKEIMVVFAGDMTWGDAPSGSGYRILNASCNYGLFHFFHIL